MANQLLIRYEGMQQAATYYTQQAEELRQMITEIKARNDQLVSSEWNGEAATSFQNRFATDYAVSMEKVAEALDDISSFLTRYAKAYAESDTKNSTGI